MPKAIRGETRTPKSTKNAPSIETIQSQIESAMDTYQHQEATLYRLKRKIKGNWKKMKQIREDNTLSLEDKMTEIESREQNVQRITVDLLQQLNGLKSSSTTMRKLVSVLLRYKLYGESRCHSMISNQSTNSNQSNNKCTDIGTGDQSEKSQTFDESLYQHYEITMDKLHRALKTKDIISSELREETARNLDRIRFIEKEHDLDLKDAQNENIKLKTETDKLRGEISQLRKELPDKEEKNKLKHSIATIEEKEEIIKHLTADNKQFKGEMDRLQQDLATLQSTFVKRRESFQFQIAEMESHEQVLTALYESEINKMKSALESKDNEMKRRERVWLVQQDGVTVTSISSHVLESAEKATSTENHAPFYKVKQDSTESTSVASVVSEHTAVSKEGKLFYKGKHDASRSSTTPKFVPEQANSSENYGQFTRCKQCFSGSLENEAKPTIMPHNVGRKNVDINDTYFAKMERKHKLSPVRQPESRDFAQKWGRKLTSPVSTSIHGKLKEWQSWIQHQEVAMNSTLFNLKDLTASLK